MEDIISEHLLSLNGSYLENLTNFTNATNFEKEITYLTIDTKRAILIPAVMFALGVFGNTLAIISLLMYRYRKAHSHSPRTNSTCMTPSPRARERANSAVDAARCMQRRRSSSMGKNRCDISDKVKRRPKKTKFSAFHALVLGLVTVDLAGNITLSPVTLLLYSTNTTIQAAGGVPLCNYSAFTFMFFGLATMTTLLTMAIERVMGIRYPYYYHQNVTPRKASLILCIILVVCACFSALPTIGFGKVKSMFPNTWCFADWHAEELKDKIFNYTYAISGIVMIVTTVICNVTVVVGLFQMKQRLKMRRNSKKHSLRRETQMIIQLCVMTCIYLTCWLPLMFRILMNQLTYRQNGESDRVAIWLAAANPILDPWVYILFRRSVIKRLASVAKSIMCFCDHQSKFKVVVVGASPLSNNTPEIQGKNEVYHRVPANEQASAIQTVVQPRVVDRPTTLARNNRSDVILSSKESLYDNVRV